MKYIISPDRATLTLEADTSDIQNLHDILQGDERETFYSADEADALENLIANSELDWTSGEETGDLTDAPLLCIRDWQNYSHAQHRFPVLERWGFEPYQVRSFLTDLMETGKAVFRNSW